MIGIIGAGPTGLAIAYLLKQHGVDFQILERGSIGYTWKKQYNALHLNTFREITSLPGMPISKNYPAFPSASQFENYLKEYANTFDLPVEIAEVTKVQFENPGFKVTTSAGDHYFEKIFIATGIWALPHHPYANSSPFEGQVLHSSEYKNAQPFSGKRVLVVGSGASAGDITVDLLKSASFVGISIANGVNIVDPITSVGLFNIFKAIFTRPWLFKLVQPLLKTMRKDHSSIGLPTHPQADSFTGHSIILGSALVNAVADGRVTPFPAFSGFSSSGAIFSDQTTADFDAIIFATGYRPAIQFARDCFEIESDGYPVTDGFQSRKYKGIYYVGPGRDENHNIGWLPRVTEIANSVVNALTQ